MLATDPQYISNSDSEKRMSRRSSKTLPIMIALTDKNTQDQPIAGLFGEFCAWMGYCTQSITARTKPGEANAA